MHRGRADLAMRFDPAAMADQGHSHGALETDLVVLTDAEDFHSAVKDAVNAQQRVWRVPSAEQAAELLISGRIGVLIVDAESLPHGAPALITRLNFEFPDLVVVVAGTHDEAPQFARLVGEGLVYRFLQKPVSAARVRAFIDAALRRHSELVAKAPAVVHARSSRHTSRKFWLALLAIALCTVGFLVTRQHQPKSAAPPPPASQNTTPAQAVREHGIDPTTAAATQTARIAEGHTAPVQADAADLARREQVAKDQATQSSARQARGLLRGADAAIAAGDLIGADAGSAQADSEQRARGDRLSGLAKLAAQRLADDMLVEPTGDSAQQYLQQLQAEDPTLSAPLMQQFAGRLLAMARRDVAQGAYDSADRWLKEAEDTGVSASDVAAVRNEAQNARARAAFLANVIPSSKLRNTKYVAPTYPPKALDQSVEGWVSLEFTLDMQGGIRDITVKNAVPTGVFEKAAVDAVAKWRYQPVTRDGAAVEQRSAIRVQFKLEK